MDPLQGLIDLFGAIGQSVDDIVLGILDLVQSVDPVTRTLLAALAIFFETTIMLGLIVPGDTVVVVASTGVSSPLEYVAMLLAVILGALLGESLGFALGRFFGPRIRRSWLGGRLGETNWRRAENYVDRRGGLAVFASRFLPVLHSLVPLTVGMSTMSYRRFLAWTAPACTVWALGYVTVGALVADGYRRLVDQLHGAGYLFVTAVLLLALGGMVVKRLVAHSQRRHWEHAGDGDARTLEEPED